MGVHRAATHELPTTTPERVGRHAGAPAVEIPTFVVDELFVFSQPSEGRACFATAPLREGTFTVETSNGAGYAFSVGHGQLVVRGFQKLEGGGRNFDTEVPTQIYAGTTEIATQADAQHGQDYGGVHLTVMDGRITIQPGYDEQDLRIMAPVEYFDIPQDD